MFGLRFVPCFQIEKGKIGMNQLLMRFEPLGLMAFRDRCLVISFAAKRHPQGKLRIKVVRVCRQDVLQLLYCLFVIAPAEGEHRVVVMILKRGHVRYEPTL